MCSVNLQGCEASSTSVEAGVWVQFVVVSKAFGNRHVRYP